MTTINTMYWNVGAHLSFNKSIQQLLLDGVRKGMYSTQFFMGNPKSYNRQNIDEQDIEMSKLILLRFPMNIYSHFPYISNLCGSVNSIAWEDDEIVNKKTKLLLKGIEHELKVMANFNNENNKAGVVIHPGSFPDRNKGLNTIIKSINHINFPENSLLLLENSAGEGNKLCKNLEEIKYVINGLLEDKRKHIGVCIDTAHIWGEGCYDLSKTEEIDRLFNEFDEQIGLEYFNLLHLNDSKVEIGTKKDRHESIGKGYIWSSNFDSLILLLNKCKEYNIPIVLETVYEDMFILVEIQSKLNLKF